MTLASMRPVDLVLYTAATQVGVTECPPNSNRGLKVEEYLKATGLGPGFPWCAAGVAWVGKTALGANWPLPLVAGCVSLYEAAKAKGMIRDVPAPGAIFLRWYASKNRFAHTGFCVQQLPVPAQWRTYEGNTSGGGSREGWMFAEQVRTWRPEDRFIHWWEAS